METVKKLNVRGAIRSLHVGSKPIELPSVASAGIKNGYKPSSIRNTASSIASDTGRRFTVSVDEKTITISRKY